MLTVVLVFSNRISESDSAVFIKEHETIRNVIPSAPQQKVLHWTESCSLKQVCPPVSEVVALTSLFVFATKHVAPTFGAPRLRT
jgi:hypothetical protein